MQNWQKKRVTVLGLGRSGVATATYLRERGASVFVSESGQADASKQMQADALTTLGVEVEFGQHSDKALAHGEFIVTSPGISPNSEVMKRAGRLGKEIISDVELAYRESRTPMIVVTGTNGKSTTTALISFILEKSGRLAPACGNIGVPILSQLDRKPDYLVVETSSYQLHYSSSLAPMVAVWLNLTPDHLDWHGSLDNYINDKKKAFANQRPDQYSVLNLDDPVVASYNPRSEVFPFSQKSALDDSVQGAFVHEGFLCYRIRAVTRLVCGVKELQIIGSHNIENALAAISTCAVVGVQPSEIEMYLKEFRALEHRLEYIATIDGVRYFNDSKATNTDSTIKALESFPNEKVVLIAGGRDKGTSLGEFVHAVRKYVSAVILIGEAKERFDRALREGGFDNIYPVNTMAEAVDLGGQLKRGPVLLSPACASFDMFKDFEDRGRVFKDIVRTRAEKLASSGKPTTN